MRDDFTVGQRVRFRAGAQVSHRAFHLAREHGLTVKGYEVDIVSLADGRGREVQDYVIVTVGGPKPFDQWVLRSEVASIEEKDW